MEVMFSAVNDGNEALTEQVAGDIEAAKEHGEVDTDEVTYINLGDNKVMVIDNVNKEATVVEGSGDEYEMEALPKEDLQEYLKAPECCDKEAKQAEFSVRTNNMAVARLFSDQGFYEKVMSDVLETEETAVIGNIQVDKVGDSEVVITDRKTGDQAKVTVDGDELEVEELEEKALSRRYSEFEPVFVVGIDPVNSTLVDAPAYSEEDANELADRLEEMGVEDIKVFEDPDQAREYAHGLMESEDAVEVEEPVQAEFSDRELYVTRFYSAADLEPTTRFMDRLYSEAEAGIEDAQEDIEDALEDGEQIENSNYIITPVSDETVVVEDKKTGEFTKATLDDETIDSEAITEKEADKLMEDIDVKDHDEEDEEEHGDEEHEEEEEEREFSEYYTRVMHKLFSEENDDLPVTQAKIEDALESGEQIEDGDIVITPVDDETAVIEDKKNDEITKVTIDEDGLESEAIDEDEADDLLEDVEVDHDTEVDEDDDDDDPEDKDEEDDEREFSTIDRFFAEHASGEGDGEMVTVRIPASALAEAQAVEGEVVPEEDGEGVGNPSVELIEDKAVAAMNSIQEAARQAAEMIQGAKQAPAPGEENDIREAQFSERYFSDPMSDWLGQI